MWSSPVHTLDLTQCYNYHTVIVPQPSGQPPVLKLEKLRHRSCITTYLVTSTAELLPILWFLGNLRLLLVPCWV